MTKLHKNQWFLSDYVSQVMKINQHLNEWLLGKIKYMTFYLTRQSFVNKIYIMLWISNRIEILEL